MAQHTVPLKIYFLIFGALLVLTLVTVGVAFLDLGPLNTMLALAIAFFKALLVLLYFMHLRYSSALTKLVVGASFFWLALMICLTLSDFLTRNWLPTPAGW